MHTSDVPANVSQAVKKKKGEKSPVVPVVQPRLIPSVCMFEALYVWHLGWRRT